MSVASHQKLKQINDSEVRNGKDHNKHDMCRPSAMKVLLNTKSTNTWRGE